MRGKAFDDSTEPGTAVDAGGPLRRWARRKREAALESEAAADARRSRGPDGTSGPRESNEAPPGPETPPGPVAPGEKVLTDEDMPPIESLGEDSDYSGFLSPGVSEALRRRALRKLFTSAVFNVRDGLDDYDEDFTTFEGLGDIVTSDMKHQAEMEAERERRARAGSEPTTGPEEGPAEEVGGEPVADAADETPAPPEEPESAAKPPEPPAPDAPERADATVGVQASSEPATGPGFELEEEAGESGESVVVGESVESVESVEAGEEPAADAAGRPEATQRRRT